MNGLVYGLALICLSAALVAAQRASTQNDINTFAKDLFIQVNYGTRHEVGGTYDVILRFFKRGRQRKILNTKDWELHFNLKGNGLLTQPFFEENGLRLSPTQGCGYKVTPITTGPKKFTGLAKQTTIAFTAEGLSLYRYDMFPRFYITAPGKIAKNIQNTDDNELEFVVLKKANQTRDDMSRVTGLQRSVTQPAVMDVGKVPDSLVIPAPQSINIIKQRGFWVDISQPRTWKIYPDDTVSATFLNLFEEKLSSLPNVSRSAFQRVKSLPARGEDAIYIQIDPKKTGSIDSYTVAVRPRIQTKTNHIIHISAKSETGLQNALESLLGVAGLFNIVPAMTIRDDARFGIRSILLDVTKNFFPAPVIKKFIRLMKMYKLNNLVLNLADDYGWRIQLDKYNFRELWTYASKRCADDKKCLDPAFGSGADETSSGSGFYRTDEYQDLLRYANNMGITITPKINLLGGIRSAKMAAKKRFDRVNKNNKKEANRLNINTPYPDIKNSQARDHCYQDGLLDPCDPATYEFIKDIVDAVGKLYRNSTVRMREFHAGGDELTRYQSLFPSCKAKKVGQAAAQRKMLKALNTEVGKFNAKLRVRQEAVIDPDTKTCLTPTSSYRIQNMYVDFWNIMPGNHNDWGLTAEELDYINAPVPAPTNGSKPDPLMTFEDKRNSTYPWSKKGIAPWAQAYSCANDGYKVILGPESFTSLDSAYELDFDEIGNRKRESFHIINLHRMMMFEPFNLHTNMDTGNDGFRYLPYRLCHMWRCVKLINKQNIVGLQATIDTAVIRDEKTLWGAVLPGLLLFAEKAWREAPFENILKAEQPETLTVLENIDRRAYYLNQEITNFTNTYGYKDSGRMDFNAYTYRVPRPGAHVDFELPMGIRGPYKVIVKTDFPGADIEFREQHVPNSQWRILFRRDDRGYVHGGYRMSFPESNQRIQIRIRSTDGKRRSLPITVRGGTTDLWPRELPIMLRNATCLPIKDAWETELNDVTPLQWDRVFYNIQDVGRVRTEEADRRNANITQLVAQYANTYNTTRDIYLIFESIQQILMSPNASILALNATSDVRRAVFFRDQDISKDQSIALEKQFEKWEQDYQKCKRGLVNPLAIFERNNAMWLRNLRLELQNPRIPPGFGGFPGLNDPMQGNMQMGGAPGQTQGGAGFQTGGVPSQTQGGPGFQTGGVPSQTQGGAGFQMGGSGASSAGSQATGRGQGSSFGGNTRGFADQGQGRQMTGGSRGGMAQQNIDRRVPGQFDNMPGQGFRGNTIRG